MEKQYVDDGFPTDFPVFAPFLADIDTSGGRGQIYYRVTEMPSVLNRVAQVCLTLKKSSVTHYRPFVLSFCRVLNCSSGLFPFPVPSIVQSHLFFCHSFTPSIHSFIHLNIQEVQRGFPDAKFTPTHAVVATWENVAAYEEQTRAAGPSNEVRWIRS